MKPTPAQIEAAAGALETRFPGTGSWLVAAESGLTAAAEVEKAKVTTWVGKAATINATIERCAQICADHGSVLGNYFAAAIRKVKEGK